MSATEYIKQIEVEWDRLANRNANGGLLNQQDLERFLELVEMRKRQGKNWQK